MPCFGDALGGGKGGADVQVEEDVGEELVGVYCLQDGGGGLP